MRKHYIKEWRKSRGLTQKQLADRMEREPGIQLMSYVTVSNIERGEQSPTLEQLSAFAEALNTTVSMLVEHHPKKDGKIVDWFDLWHQANEESRRTMMAVAKAALGSTRRTGTDG